MKRPVGLSILASLFALWGLYGIGKLPSSEAGALERIPQLTIALLILATGYGLFRMRSWTLRVFIVGVGLGIILGLARDASGGTPILVVVVWGILMTAAWVAVGIYIRSSVPDAG